MPTELTPQEQVQQHHQAQVQIHKSRQAEAEKIKRARASLKKYDQQLATIEVQKELLLRTHNLCFNCHKNLSSDEVKFCIDQKLQPLCQPCQRKRATAPKA